MIYTSFVGAAVTLSGMRGMQGTIQTISTWQDTGTCSRNNQEERDPAVLGTVNAVLIRQQDPAGQYYTDRTFKGTR